MARFLGLVCVNRENAQSGSVQMFLERQKREYPLEDDLRQ